MIRFCAKLSSSIKAEVNKLLGEFSKVILALAHSWSGSEEIVSLSTNSENRKKKLNFEFFLQQRKYFSAKFHIWEKKMTKGTWETSLYMSTHQRTLNTH